jgi:hypothetical protein
LHTSARFLAESGLIHTITVLHMVIDMDSFVNCVVVARDIKLFKVLDGTNGSAWFGHDFPRVSLREQTER